MPDTIDDIRQRMADLDMTQDELAVLLNITQGNVSRMLRADRRYAPGRERLEQIAAVLDCRLALISNKKGATHDS